MGIKRKIIRIVLLTAVLLFLYSCGIPRMFQWDVNDEWQRNNSVIRFNMSYLRSSSGQTESIPVESKNGFPRLNFYYAIGTTTGLSGSESTGTSAPSGGGVTASRIASAFNSRYSSSVPPSRQRNDNTPIVSSSVTITSAPADDNTTTIGLYQFTDTVTSDRPDFPDDISYFLPPDSGIADDGTETPVDPSSYSWLPLNGYDKAVTYSASAVRYDDGYAIEITLYPEGPEDEQITYTLLRNNGQTFKASIDEYIGSLDGGEVGEFTENDDPASNFLTPAIYVFVSCSFSFQGYTTVSTIPLDIVGNPIELSSLTATS